MQPAEFNPDKARQFIEERFDNSALPSLMEYIRIPNLSRQYDKEWNTNGLLQKAAQHIKAWVESMEVLGLKIQIIKEPDYSPLIFIEIEGSIKSTVMYYGHYDKQPPFTGWWEGFGPTTPIIKDGKLYGRGGADDGYSIYGAILAIKSLQMQGVAHPRCVVIAEGDEESGSAHLFHYLDSLKTRIGNPSLFFCLDSGTLDYQRFWLTRSLRGNLTATINVEVLKEGCHSGEASGIVPSSFRILRSLLDRIEDAKTGEINKIFHVNVPANRYNECYDLAKEKQKQVFEDKYPFIEGVQPVSTDPLTCLLNKCWKPQMTITGAAGFPDPQVAGNVMLPSATMKLSLRLPPTLDGPTALANLEKLILENPPYGAKEFSRGKGIPLDRYTPRKPIIDEKSLSKDERLFNNFFLSPPDTVHTPDFSKCTSRRQIASAPQRDDLNNVGQIKESVLYSSNTMKCGFRYKRQREEDGRVFFSTKHINDVPATDLDRSKVEKSFKLTLKREDHNPFWKCVGKQKPSQTDMRLMTTLTNHWGKGKAAHAYGAEAGMSRRQMLHRRRSELLTQKKVQVLQNQVCALVYFRRN